MTINMIKTGIAKSNPAAFVLFLDTALKVANANHTHRATKNNWTMVTDIGHTFRDIHERIHFFIFFGNVTFIL
jgi:hypothetical protein